MMRVGKIPVVLAAVAVAAFASSAGAQEFSLSPSPTITGGPVIFTGLAVGLQQTISINCSVSATLNVAGGGGSFTASLATPSIYAGQGTSSAFCGLQVYAITSWSAYTVTGQNIPNSGGSAQVLVWVGANTIMNDPCRPQPVQALLTTPFSGPSTITFNNVLLDAQSGRLDRRCRINGVLTATGVINNRVFIH